MRHIAFVFFAFTALSFNASAENYSIKGYTLGQQMAACPEGSVSTPGKVMLLCSLGPTTYAGAEASDHTVVIYNNEVIGIMVKLKSRGRYANSGVLDAMKEKFGNPTQSKSHLNAYAWRQGSAELSFDGYAGTVLLIDTEKNRAAMDSRAKAVKDDL